MKWYGYAQLLITRNSMLNQKCEEISSILGSDGFRSVILKGQANAIYYPIPEERTPGDIDIWIEGNRKYVIDYISSKIELDHVQFHHTGFNILPDVDIEAHFHPTVIFNYFGNKRLQQIFLEEQNASMENWVESSDGYKFRKLTMRADVLMQVGHLYRHFIHQGIGLRQVLDLFLLLTKNSYSLSLVKQLRNDIVDIRLYKFVQALTYVMKELFYLDERYFLAEPNTKLGELLLHELIIGGNFGNNFKSIDIKRELRIRSFLIITLQSFRLFFHYPKDCLWFVVFRITQGFWKIHNHYK